MLAECGDGVHSGSCVLQEPGNHATLYVGHDGNLDGLAVLLGLRWAAPPPYRGGEVLPTPPGSALLFDVSPTDQVSVSFLYPTFSGSAAAADGRLSSVPLLRGLTLDGLRNRALRGLRAHADAGACFRRACSQSGAPVDACEALERPRDAPAHSQTSSSEATLVEDSSP